MSAVGRLVGWEVRKLIAQKRSYLGLAVAAATPVVMVAAFTFQDKLPLDYPFGRYLRLSGYATSLVLLGFAAIWEIPLLVGLVAGDIFAAEDQHATWKLTLTRSVSRLQVFTAKVLAAFLYAVSVLLAIATSSVLFAGLCFGFGGLPDLSGHVMTSKTTLEVTLAAWALALPSVLAFACLGIGLSVLTRNSAAGTVTPVVLALAMSLAGSLGGVGPLRHYLLTSQFEGFHGILHSPHYDPQIWRAVWLPAVWGIVALAVSMLAFLRRDVTQA